MIERKEGAFAGRIGPAFEVKLDSVAEDGTFEGYGSVFGNMDNGGDVMVPGCFTKSLAMIPANRVKMLWQHDSSQVIGKWLEMREDNRGLYCKGRLFMGVAKGKECYELMKEEAVDGLSIGFRTIQDEYDREAGLRRLTEVKLMEVSVVTFPMNELATVSMVKGDGTIVSEREIEAHLRDAGLSRKQAKAFVSGGYKAMCDLRDAGSEGAEETGILDALRGLRASLTSS